MNPQFARCGAVALTLLIWAEPGRTEAQIAIQPGIGTIPDGVGMTAVPAVSADRRYVRLSVNAGFQTVDGFTTLPVPFGVSGLGSGSGLAGLGGGVGLPGLGGAGGAAGGPGAVAGVPMGMNGPQAAPRAAEAVKGNGGPLADGVLPWNGGAGPIANGSFDNSFRQVPDPGPGPTRRAAKAARSPRTSRPRTKPNGS